MLFLVDFAAFAVRVVGLAKYFANERTSAWNVNGASCLDKVKIVDPILQAKWVCPYIFKTCAKN
jgi:hypothetical protein